jgi:hypothetical protein
MSKPIPTAPHTVEPYDGHDRMVRCSGCVRSQVYNDHYGRRTPTGCISYVPSMAAMLRHCGYFRGLPRHARASA